MNHYRAVFFDFGDTLAYDCPSIPEGLARIFRNMGLETTTDEVQQARRDGLELTEQEAERIVRYLEAHHQ